ncbi:Csu type fimbrial protein [Pseudoxanthomonas suwonensis]|uniref:Spore coat protein U/FanG domain-containing protein n=1 Tax=Pseudoxanthomonas suwonensis TaxID=314722 RepID=A0A0E3UNV7_9GAMM|nr:spore coat U domain-containing protein [Pseudoxanthomonas suwonensis]AKC87506.1 hypothetical protein WQ53_12820 [Pseudoxanthomonas suwonensis]
MNLFKSTLIASALVAAGIAGNASAATATGNFQVRINITESCAFSTTGASDVNFGDKARSSSGNADNTGTLVVNCTQGTPFNIGLNAGTYTGATVATRRMSNGANSIPYSLYRDSNRTLNWGNTVSTDTHAGTGTGANQSISVYGRVAGGAAVNVPAGVYTDTIQATITY